LNEKRRLLGEKGDNDYKQENPGKIGEGSYEFHNPAVKIHALTARHPRQGTVQITGKII